MNAKTLGKYQIRAQILKALAHPTRLFLVDELAKRGEECVCKLTALVGSDMSTVSRHLALLKWAGIVQDEKRGSMVYYRLRVKCIMDFFRCVESVLACNGDECAGQCDSSTWACDTVTRAPVTK